MCTIYNIHLAFASVCLCKHGMARELGPNISEAIGQSYVRDMCCKIWSLVYSRCWNSLSLLEKDPFCKADTTHVGLGPFCSPWVSENLTHWLPWKKIPWKKKQHHPLKDPKTFLYWSFKSPSSTLVCCVHLRIFRFPGRALWEEILPSFHSIDGWVMDPFQPRQRVEDALSLEEVDMTGSWMRLPFGRKHQQEATVTQWVEIML